MNVLLSVGKLLVFSPHLDDAVLSCGEMLAQHAGAEVVTVFAALPQSGAPLTRWDAASGFHSAQEALAKRWQEDDAALTLLSAHPVRLDFCDSQYDATPSQQDLSDHLHQLLQRADADTVMLPAGLFHSDHILLHQALMAIRHSHPGKMWLMYEDALYRRIPGLLQQRLSFLERGGVRATPLEFLHDERMRMLKRQAVSCYASQLRALTNAANGYADVFMQERYWLLAANEAGRVAGGK
ncbi:MAG TPA: PIG-L family deacetylase [Oxalicibacterium sp.]|nr:PIG-L family deacetylase [Oxalicibacterium sp.]